MLFNPSVLMHEPIKLLVVVAIIMVGKTLAAIGLVLLFRYPLKTAMTVGASLAQIGEFSFILASKGVAMRLLPPEGYSLILAGALLTIACNSFTFKTIEPVIFWMKKKSNFVRKLNLRGDPLAQLPMTTEQSLLQGQVVIVGYGRVGGAVARALREKNIAFVVVESNREMVGELRKKGLSAVSGDASDPAVLIQAHIAKASFLVIATKDPLDIYSMVETSKKINTAIKILIRAKSSEEAAIYKKSTLGDVFVAENELAHKLAEIIFLQKSML
jgi:CPA2 family monovalent cation:H+ antiporter-2